MGMWKTDSPLQSDVCPLDPASPASQAAFEKKSRIRNEEGTTFISFWFFETLWLLKEGAILFWSMSFGIKWLWMTVRILTFGAILSSTFFKFFWWYMNSPKIFRRVEYRQHAVNDTFAHTIHNVGNDNNRAYLDLHFPVPCADVLRARSVAASRSSCKHKKTISLDSSYKCMESTPTEFPVIVCVTGGAWIVGSHYWSAMLARVMGDNDYLVVSPDYRNFPQATIPQMVEDVTDAIRWVFRHIEDYGGDPERITLLGQSAGAHLLFMSIVEQIELLAKGETPKYDPRMALRVGGLSGLYDLVSVEDHLNGRGLYRQVLYAICGGKDKLEDLSPLRRLEKLPIEAFDLYYPKQTVLIHGTRDASAPWEESDNLATVLKAKCAEADERRGDVVMPWREINLHLLPGETHTSPFVEDPLLQRSQVVEILAELDGNMHPIFEVRPAMAGRKRLKVASMIMPF